MVESYVATQLHAAPTLLHLLSILLGSVVSLRSYVRSASLLNYLFRAKRAGFITLNDVIMAFIVVAPHVTIAAE